MRITAEVLVGVDIDDDGNLVGRMSKARIMVVMLERDRDGAPLRYLAGYWWKGKNR